MSRNTAMVLASVPLLLLTGAAAPLDAQVSVNQTDLARQMGSEDVATRHRAIASVRALPAASTGPELRAALIDVLRMEGEIRKRQAMAERRGQRPEPSPDPEFILEIVPVVAALRDPQSIPALISALFVAPRPREALADFGEQVVEHLLDALRSPDVPVYVVSEGLIILRFIVEGASSQPISPQSRARIRQFAEDRLTKTQDELGTGVRLRYAIDLAIALNDPGLRQIVQRLAADGDAVIARGVLANAQGIRDIQQHALDRLAGVPAIPRRGSS